MPSPLKHLRPTLLTHMCHVGLLLPVKLGHVSDCAPSCLGTPLAPSYALMATHSVGVDWGRMVAGGSVCSLAGSIQTQAPHTPLPVCVFRISWLVECCFTSTETIGLLGMGSQDSHLNFHTAPELTEFPFFLSFRISTLKKKKKKKYYIFC